MTSKKCMVLSFAGTVAILAAILWFTSGYRTILGRGEQLKTSETALAAVEELSLPPWNAICLRESELKWKPRPLHAEVLRFDDPFVYVAIDADISVHQDVVELLKRLPALRELEFDVSDEAQATEQTSVCLAGLEKLTQITFHYRPSQLMLQAVRESTADTLVLASTGLTDADLIEVGKWDHVRVLDIADNKKITPKGIAALRDLSLKELYVNGLDIHGTDLIPVLDTQSIECLDLSTCPITDDDLRIICNRASSLKRLALRSTPITEKAIKILESHGRLEIVDLSACNLQSEQVDYLRQRIDHVIFAPPLIGPDYN